MTENFSKAPQAIAIIIATLFFNSYACATGMEDLGTFGGGSSSSAFGVSADGTVIVGQSNTADNAATHAFKYSDGAMTDILTLGGSESYAYAVSANGTVIVGQSNTAGNTAHAFKYIGSTMTDLGTLDGLDGSYSAAFGVSSDGSVIVGSSSTADNAEHAFKYTGLGPMEGLDTLGGTNSLAFGVSADGTVIVGQSNTAGDVATHAFRYTGLGPMEDLDTLGGTYSNAYAVSGDGVVIVGRSNIAGDTATHAFKYTDLDGMEDLGTLDGPDGFYSSALGVSSNGAVIVGESQTADGLTHAFKYTGTTMTDLGTLGGTDSYAYAVSSDGSVIVGAAYTADGVYHAFLYRNSMLDIDNTYAALASNSYQLNAVMNSQSNLLNIGLNHDCTLYGANNLCVAVGGAYHTVNHAHAAQTTANLRLGYQVTPNMHIGVFIDQSAANSMPANYDLKHDMPLVGAFASWSQYPNGIGAKIKGSVAYSKRDVTITRSTLAYTEAGKGDSTLSSKAAQIEGAWGMALNADWMAEPFAGVRVSQISREGYQEDNVDFPISYNAVQQTATTAYVGARLSGQVTAAVTADLSAGVESDIHQHISDHTGSINTLGDYALSAPNRLHSRGFVHGALNYAISPTQTVNVGVNVHQDALNHAVGAAAMLSYVVGL